MTTNFGKNVASPAMFKRPNTSLLIFEIDKLSRYRDRLLLTFIFDNERFPAHPDYHQYAQSDLFEICAKQNVSSSGNNWRA